LTLAATRVTLALLFMEFEKQASRPKQGTMCEQTDVA
jgi:hypothetical protein